MPLLLGHTEYTIKLTITYSRYTNSNTRPGLDWREQKALSFLSFFYKEILTTTRNTKITNTNTRPKLSNFKNELIQCKQAKGAGGKTRGTIVPTKDYFLELETGIRIQFIRNYSDICSSFRLDFPIPMNQIRRIRMPNSNRSHNVAVQTYGGQLVIPPICLFLHNRNFILG